MPWPLLWPFLNRVTLTKGNRMKEWELLKDMVKTRKELKRVQLKYFNIAPEEFRSITRESDLSLNESIRMIDRAIEELTNNLTR